MPTAACLAAILQKQPPTTCTDAFCIRIRARIDEFCHKAQLVTDTPIPEEEDGVECWCCCSCFAYDTAIQVSQGKKKKKGKKEEGFALIQDILVGDTVLATGVDVSSWKKKKVTTIGGIPPDTLLDFMFHMAYNLDAEPGQTRFIITTSDHLFLMASGKLNAVQYFVPGDQIRSADGGIATVVFNVPGQFQGGVRHIALGDFDGKDLNGHLINSNGIVSSDFSVQTYYVTHNLPPNLQVDLPDNAPQAGSAKYRALYPSAEADEFIANKNAWPKGFRPHDLSLLNVPATAHSFLTEAQAKDIEKAHENNIFASGEDLSTVRYLIDLLGALFPGITYLVDWANDLPNAYAWEQYGEKFISVTGGLVRGKELGRDGLSLVLCTMVAHQDGNNVECVGPADYAGTLQYMRQLWFSDLYFDAFNNGLDEVQALFALISEEHSHGDPHDICAQPSIECRLATYQAAKSMAEIPTCAMPRPEDLWVMTATASPDLLKVTVVFNRPLDPTTAQTSENYTIEPGVTVDSATINENNDASVELEVSGLQPGTDYLLTVASVTSIDNRPLNPEHSSSGFSTD